MNKCNHIKVFWNDFRNILIPIIDNKIQIKEKMIESFKLKEESINWNTGKTTFTHKRLVSEYRSLRTNLSIANTTNNIDRGYSFITIIINYKSAFLSFIRSIIIF